ncbi:hypothetical protein ABLB69_18570 [Xenorhabdus khoisanae]|uniref:hypothetical protein n=1 Tax=Xenorhabdus khoisanae TaxID=880157 RepID=UPI0032B7F67F
MPVPEESETDNTAQVRVPDRESNPRIIAQPDTDKVQVPEVEHAPVDKAQTPATFPRKNPVIPPYQPDNQPESVLPIPEMECLHFSQTGLEPVSSVWEISPMQDDIEHLQTMAFRLAFELAEIMGCDNNLLNRFQLKFSGILMFGGFQFHRHTSLSC